MDGGDDSTGCNADVVQEFVKLLIISYCQLNVARNDTDLLVVTGGIASELKDFSR